DTGATVKTGSAGSPEGNRQGESAATAAGDRAEAVGPGGSRSPAAVAADSPWRFRSEEHTSELQSRENLVCRLLLEKKKKQHHHSTSLIYFTCNSPRRDLHSFPTRRSSDLDTGATVKTGSAGSPEGNRQGESAATAAGDRAEAVGPGGSRSPAAVAADSPWRF